MEPISTRALALAGALVAALALAAPAVAQDEPAVNTWEGVCTQMRGAAVWPELPLTMTPVDTLLVADLTGGRCIGHVNGEPYDGEVETIHFDYRGVQSCAYGVIEGPAHFRLGGADFYGSASYARVGIFVRVQIDGDAGGHVVAFVRGTGDHGDGYEPLNAFLSGCLGDGVRRAAILVETSVAAGLRSYVREDSAGGGG